MRRRVFGMIGFTLSLLCAAPSLASAQENPLAIPKASDPTETAPADDDGIKTDVKISPNTGMPMIEQPAEQKVYPIAECARLSSEYMDPRFAANSSHPDDPGIWENLLTGYGEQTHRLLDDYGNFYLTDNLLYVGVAVAIAAPLANTHADQGLRDWYQRHAGQGRSHAVDNTALFFKNFGEVKYAIPGYLAFSLPGHMFPDNPCLSAFSEFGDRGLRALAVGAPTMLLLQYGLGGQRPFAEDSHWQPFRSSHGASGHAFVGAIPFLTAASMTDSRALQALLFAGSLAPAWSRIHTDDHYVSQAFLGWAIAYLAVQAVNQTECQWFRNACIVPIEGGLAVRIEY